MQSYDTIAGFYDWDMGQNNSGEDVAFYVRECRAAAGPVLELGCGTGRITVPLVQAGLRVVAADSSLPMLRRLQERRGRMLSPAESGRLQIVAMDMRRIGFAERFSRILCPFSLLTYLVKEKERRIFLQEVKEHLAPGGRMLLDVFTPDEELHALPDDRCVLDYRREIPGGWVLERRKQIRKKNRPDQVHSIFRFYRFYRPDGILEKEIRTEEDIRYFRRADLHAWLESQGFLVAAEYGDFVWGPPVPSSKVIVMACAVGGTSE